MLGHLGTTIVCMLLVAMPVFSVAEDWPQFRGPTGQGHSSEKQLPTHWSSTENVSWSVELPGEGWSSPVCVGGKIYLTSAIPQNTGATTDYSLRCLRLDESTGAIDWNVEVFLEKGSTSPRIHSKNSHASPTPLIDGDRVYVHFGHEGTACLSLDGKLLWRNDRLRYNPVHGNGGSPIIVDDLLVFSCDGGDDPFVVALDTRTGDLRWKTDRQSDAEKKFSFSTPLVIEVQGKKQIISPGSNAVCAYDPATGSEIWRVRYDGYSVIPRPVFGHGLIFISSGYEQPQVLAIRADGKGDVTETHIAWSTARGAPHTPSLLLVDNELYMVSDRGVASCLDAKSGDLIWQQRLGGDFSASPLYANGLVYFQNESGVGYVVEHGREFRQVAKNELGQATLASYGVGEGALLIRAKTHLFRIAR